MTATTAYGLVSLAGYLLLFTVGMNNLSPHSYDLALTSAARCLPIRRSFLLADIQHSEGSGDIQVHAASGSELYLQVLERDTHFNQADLRVDRTDSAPVLDEPQLSEVQNPVS